MTPNLHAVPEQPPEPTGSNATSQEVRAALERHLDATLDRAQADLAQLESPERRDRIENAASEYVLGLLEGMVADDGQFEAQLIQKGARDVRGNWELGGPLLTFLNEQVAGSMAARIAALEKGQYCDPSGKRTDRQMLNDGMRKQIRSIVARFQQPRDVYEDRRKAA